MREKKINLGAVKCVKDAMTSENVYLDLSVIELSGHSYGQEP